MGTVLLAVRLSVRDAIIPPDKMRDYLALYERVVLTQDLSKEGPRPGDVGVIVEHYPARADVTEGYGLEVFAASGKTITVVSGPASVVREATEHDALSVRSMPRA